MQQSLTTIIGSGFILVGILITVYLVYRLRQAFSSHLWPGVVGDLDSADLRRVVYRGKEVNGTLDQASADIVSFAYHYQVHGQTYRGTRVTFSDAINKTSSSLKKIQAMHQGKDQIVVYYNPKNPDQSVLIPGTSLYNFTPFITSLLFIGVGYFIMILDI